MHPPRGPREVLTRLRSVNRRSRVWPLCVLLFSFSFFSFLSLFFFSRAATAAKLETPLPGDGIRRGSTLKHGEYIARTTIHDSDGDLLFRTDWSKFHRVFYSCISTKRERNDTKEFVEGYFGECIVMEYYFKSPQEEFTRILTRWNAV